MAHYIHRDRTHYHARGAQDGHLDFHTAPEIFLTMAWFVLNVVLRPQRPYRLLGTGEMGGVAAQDVHLDFHTAPEQREAKWQGFSAFCSLFSHSPRKARIIPFMKLQNDT